MRAPCTHARGVCVWRTTNEALVLALIGLVALAGSAATVISRAPGAGSLLSEGPVYVPYSWTGFYVGLNGGGAFGNSSWDSTGNRNISGGLVGGTIGYNYQWGRAVFGVEADIDWADINGSTNNGCPLGCKTSDT
jgi:outer membrane immunogenic protein